MRLVNVRNLTSTMKLAKPIYHQDRVLLYPECNNLLDYKNRLLELGIHYIYVEDEKSKNIEVSDVVKPQTRQQSRKIIHNTIENISQNKKINVKQVNQTVKNLISEILERDKILVSLLNIKTTDSYTFDHSVNVAILSLLVGTRLNFDRSLLLKLGVGALLHDIGKAYIPEKILTKPASLTDKEYEIVKEHPQLGYENTKEYHNISPLSRTIILSHHERIDGTGYPQGLSKGDIHQLARIVAITDVFDALTSDRCYRDRWPVNKATNFLLSHAGTHFDSKLVNKFLRSVAIYPTGVTVKLTTGQQGIVKQQNPGWPERPVVRLITDQEGNELENYQTVDLMETLDLVIEDSEV